MAKSTIYAFFLFIVFVSPSHQGLAADNGVLYGKLEVTISPSIKDEQVLENLKKYDVVANLQSHLIKSLRLREVYTDTSTKQIHITITSFRLKSGLSTVVGGFMTGKNHIKTEVEIVDSGKVIQAFGQKIKHLPKTFSPTPSYSVNHMINVYSQRLSDKLSAL